MFARTHLLLCVLALSSLAIAAQQTPAGSSSSKHAKAEHHVKSDPSADLAEKVYRNSAYGFTYSVPYGWVERTRDMQTDDTGAPKPHPAAGKVLLAVFERPPEAMGETVNSAVLIAEEPVSSYPGLKTEADYLGPITELATSKGFHSTGDPSELTFDGRTLVRADFRRDLGKVTMQQATLILLDKKSIVSFTFIGGSEDEVDELIDGLSFSARRPAASKK
jgi:hypothetical protein